MSDRLLDYTVLFVEDLDRSLAFYVDVLGCLVSHRHDPYAQLHTGTTRLAFYTRDAMSETLGVPLARPADDAPAFEIGFKFDDVDAVYEDLVARGVPSVSPPIDQPWGQRTAWVRDPDGNLVELVQDRTSS